MNALLQVRTERDVNLLTGGDVLRVLYRPEGGRRWTRFVLVPDDDQSLDELEEHAALAADAHFSSFVGER